MPGELVELDERALVEAASRCARGRSSCPWRAASRRAFAEPACTASSMRRSRSASLPGRGVDVDVVRDVGPLTGSALTLTLLRRPWPRRPVSCANLVPMTDHEASRPPLDPAALDAGAVRLAVELARRPRPRPTPTSPPRHAGRAAGLVLVADHQTAGRGRLGPPVGDAPGASLTVSSARPGRRRARWPWLPLLPGSPPRTRTRAWPTRGRLEVAQRRALGPGGQQALRHPAGAGRAAGATPLAVLGIGLNVGQARGELPVPDATSLASPARDGRPDRAARCAARGAGPGCRLGGRGGPRWRRGAYLALVRHPGREVPGRRARRRGPAGRATDIDGHGRLCESPPIGHGAGASWPTSSPHVPWSSR